LAYNQIRKALVVLCIGDAPRPHGQILIAFGPACPIIIVKPPSIFEAAVLIG
jgi:hypothetical protein